MKKDFLAEIVEYKKDLVERKKKLFGSTQFKIDNSKLTRYHLFRKAISQPGQLNLIAEIKKASPSKGLIRDRFVIEEIAEIYRQNGAVALSILTEDKYFLGRPEYLQVLSHISPLPLLRKDFIIDEFEVYEGFRLGASAVLLIVAILDDDQLKQLMQVASDLDMDCLVEIHNEKELERALAADADIIGINNRNLHTFEVDFAVSERIIPQIPDGKIIVAESGIDRHQQIQRLQELGAHAVLIGETFMRAEDIAAKMKDVMEGIEQ